LLLAPVGRLRSLRATQAIYAGLFTNEVVPLRFGELVRAFLASRWLDSRIPAVVPSMVVERFLDALWLAAGIGIAAIFVPLPKNLTEAGDVLGGVVLAAIVVFVWIVMRRERELEHGVDERAPKTKVTTAVAHFISGLARGLREIGISRNLYTAAVLSAAMLACQALAVWFIMLACGLNLPIGVGAVVLLVVRLGTAIPNAPANVGSFQFFTVLALGLFGVDKTLAAGFSIVDFAILTAPLWIIGLFALARTGMTLGMIKAEISALRKT
ncbi:MAG TPA: lysylphosphatidylglycerol synthase transmembrane domain-containing protein, partial [Terriglobales bacterium]|nr:lysylphosphatidylglycerol synthase transmembrane domain-containing protein [Terriglobales bacterium]